MSNGLEIKAVNYMDFLSLVGDCFSLDVSVTGTGWVRYINGVVATGNFSVANEETHLDKRKAFRRELINQFGGAVFEFVTVEDVIGSINFDTANILYQLNPIVDDMVDDGILTAGKVVRVGNTTWKSNLKLASGWKESVRAESDVKRIVRECLALLGFGDGSLDVYTQDEYDAMGMLIGTIYAKFYEGKTSEKKKKLQTDLSKKYKVSVFTEYNKALTKAVKVGRKIEYLDLRESNKDVKKEFKEAVALRGDEAVFLITAKTSKLGVLAIEKKVNLDTTLTYLVAYI